MQAPIIADVYLRPPRPLRIPLAHGRRLSFPGGHAEVVNGDDMPVVLQLADAVVDIRPGYDHWLPDWITQCGPAPGVVAEVRVNGEAWRQKPVRLKDEFGRFIRREPEARREERREAREDERRQERREERREERTEPPPSEPEEPAAPPEPEEPVPAGPPATYPPTVFRGDLAAVGAR